MVNMASILPVTNTHARGGAHTHHGKRHRGLEHGELVADTLPRARAERQVRKVGRDLVGNRWGDRGVTTKACYTMLHT